MSQIKLLVWDVTVVSTLAQSYVAAAARGRGEVAELAATRKRENYAKCSTTLYKTINGTHRHIAVRYVAIGPAEY